MMFEILILRKVELGWTLTAHIYKARYYDNVISKRLLQYFVKLKNFLIFVWNFQNTF